MSPTLAQWAGGPSKSKDGGILFLEAFSGGPESPGASLAVHPCPGIVLGTWGRAQACLSNFVPPVLQGGSWRAARRSCGDRGHWALGRNLVLCEGAVGAGPPGKPSLVPPPPSTYVWVVVKGTDARVWPWSIGSSWGTPGPPPVSAP